jgi:23S rRNA pseudouridine1911/1915/1917 synthase
MARPGIRSEGVCQRGVPLFGRPAAMSAPSLYRIHCLTARAGGTPLFAFLSAHLSGLSRSLARKAVQAGLVEVDGEPWTWPAQLLPDREVQVRCDFRQGIAGRLQAVRRAGKAALDAPPVQVLYCDREVVVVDKAAGALAVPSFPGEHGSVQELLYGWLRQQGQETRWIGMVHRLDRETSGCLCFALDRETQRLLAAQFAAHAAARRYRCLVQSGPRRDRDTLTGHLGRGPDGRRAVVRQGQPGKSAVTHFQVLARFARGAELQVELETGRTHQIRVHLAYIGCPVIGDRLYGRDDPDMAALRPSRLMLHAWELRLDHPRTGERLVVNAPLPAAYAAMCLRLGGRSA